MPYHSKKLEDCPLGHTDPYACEDCHLFEGWDEVATGYFTIECSYDMDEDKCAEECADYDNCSMTMESCRNFNGRHAQRLEKESS